MLKFMFGAVLGAGVALLLAPKSGEDLRDDLTTQVREGIEQGKDIARNVSRKARKLGEQAQERTT